MVSAIRLRDLISAYLSGSASLESFSNQFAFLSSDIEKSGNAESIQLSYQIESVLADLSAGLISEPTMREAISILSREGLVRVNKEFSVPEVFEFKKRDEASAVPVKIELEYA